MKARTLSIKDLARATDYPGVARSRAAGRQRPDRRSEGDAVDMSYWRRRLVGGPLKRLFDVACASAALLFLAPLLATIMIAVRQDGGPALFRHRRIGQGGRVFECLKFRSMVLDGDRVLREHLLTNPADAEIWRETQKLPDDPRVTPIGRFLRATSLDELPQLFNIVRGDMSIVGPRPVVADELKRYKLDHIHYLCARPGLTGLWQVSGRSDTTYAQRVALDKEYVTAWSFVRDMWIVLKTVPAVLERRGAY